MFEFLRKFENLAIKRCQDKPILTTKIYQFTVDGVRCDVDVFKLTASAQSIYRDVYGSG